LQHKRTLRYVVSLRTLNQYYISLIKKSYGRTGSDNVTSQTKGTPHDSDRISTADDEYTDVL